jgi:GT2 family glycosyltransferase
VLILTPVKDAVRFLPHYIQNLNTLTYPNDRISLAFLESDSQDDSYQSLMSHLPELQAKFAKVKLFKQDFGYRTHLPQALSQQRQRRGIIAKSRNILLSQALTDEEWVLWIDVDLHYYPPDVIEQLLAAEKEIVVPHCVLEDNEDRTFDLNTFKLKPGAAQWDWSPYILDGIIQPPIRHGRYYLSDLRQHQCIEVDGVGGTMLLVRADIHREGLVFPNFPYKYHIETQGLAYMARDMGYRCWGLPNLEIVHPDL